MKNKIQNYIDEIQSLKSEALQNKIADIEQFRIKYLGKKGIISELFGQFKDVPNDQKKEIGQMLNQLKTAAQNKIEELKDALGDTPAENAGDTDLTKPTDFAELGSRHVLSVVQNEIIEIFSRIGFTVSEAPEIEDDWHVFSALNFPPEHPARDMQDTFFVEKEGQHGDVVLRTHTSSVQVREMERSKPPIRIIAPGRVFRNEAISARAHCIFHQVEGLYIDKKVSFADLKQTLLYFSKEMFGADTQIRLRRISPSPSPRQRWTSRATYAAARAATYANTPDGWKSSAAAWWTPTYWKPAASTAKSIRDSLSEWVWNVWQC